MTNLRLQDIFARVNRDANQSLSRDEVAAFAKRARVGDGFLGRTKIQLVVDEFMKAFDQDQNNEISWQEFLDNFRKLLAISGLGVEVFDAADVRPHDGKVCYDELKPEFKRRMKAAGGSWIDMKADVAAKMAVAAFGRGSEVHRDDLVSLIHDIEDHEKQRVRIMQASEPQEIGALNVPAGMHGISTMASATLRAIADRGHHFLTHLGTD